VSEPRVTRNEAASRFEIFVEDELAGFAEYRLTDGGIDFTHTVVDDAFEGQGIGSRLAKAALQTAKDAGLTITASCSFIRGYLRRHPELA
jgi:predicted GNAT family acetyltransferase